MSINGIESSLASLGSQYNFKKMTNAEFLTAVAALGNEVKISQSDTTQLSFVAQGVDSVPISGASPSVSQILSDPTVHDFISRLQGDNQSAQAPGTVGGALYDQMLKALQTYQDDSTEKTGQSSSI